MLLPLIIFISLLSSDSLGSERGVNEDSNPNIRFQPGPAKVTAKADVDDDAQREAKKLSSDGIKRASGMTESEGFKNLLNEQSEKIRTLPTEQLKTNLDLRPHQDPTSTRSLVDEILKEANQNPGSRDADNKFRALFLTLSMPDIDIKKYLKDAEIYGFGVVIRGLVDGDMKATIRRIVQLKGSDSMSGVMIDPVLFKQFEVRQSPTFILGLDPVERCMKEPCKVPRHVRATGSVSIDYFLEAVEKAGSKLAVETAIKVKNERKNQ